MKIKGRDKFSIPDGIFGEPMPGKAFKLLCFLFSLSDFAGLSRPGYAAMQRAIRDCPRENGSRTTVRGHLCYLQQRGWIFHMKRTSGRMAIWLQIPPRLRPASKVEEKPILPISVVQ